MYKRWISVSLAMLLALAAVSAFADAQLDSATAVATLPEDRNDGSVWTYEISDETVFICTGNEPVSPDAAGMTPMRSFRFEARQDGMATLTMRYALPGAESEVYKTILYYVAVEGGVFTCFAQDTGDEDDGCFVLSLPSNPTTGYGWNVSFDREGAAEVESQFYVADEASEGMTGGGGHEYLHIRGLAPGWVYATFRYMRSWDADSIEAEFTICLKVADDLTTLACALEMDRF